jgi:hypothetical protein
MQTNSTLATALLLLQGTKLAREAPGADNTAKLDAWFARMTAGLAFASIAGGGEHKDGDRKRAAPRAAVSDGDGPGRRIVRHLLAKQHAGASLRAAMVALLAEDEHASGRTQRVWRRCDELFAAADARARTEHKRLAATGDAAAAAAAEAAPTVRWVVGRLTAPQRFGRFQPHDVAQRAAADAEAGVRRVLPGRAGTDACRIPTDPAEHAAWCDALLVEQIKTMRITAATTDGRALPGVGEPTRGRCEVCGADTDGLRSVSVRRTTPAETLLVAGAVCRTVACIARAEAVLFGWDRDDPAPAPTPTPDSQAQRFQCSHCAALSRTPLARCGRCRTSCYCDRSCQAAAWTAHQPACRLRASPAAADDPLPL